MLDLHSMLLNPPFPAQAASAKHIHCQICRQIQSILEGFNLMLRGAVKVEVVRF